MRRIFIMALGCMTLLSCGPSKSRMQKVAKENLELSVEYPQKLKIIAVSEPDSAFGTGYFTEKETKGMMLTMQVVTDTIMKRTSNMSKFDPEDHYVISLAERQMQGMSEISSMIMKGGRKAAFSGWKVKIDYSCVDSYGIPYRAERWCFLDREGKQVYKTFELPLP